MVLVLNVSANLLGYGKNFYASEDLLVPWISTLAILLSGTGGPFLLLDKCIEAGAVENKPVPELQVRQLPIPDECANEGNRRAQVRRGTLYGQHPGLNRHLGLLDGFASLFLCQRTPPPLILKQYINVGHG